MDNVERILREHGSDPVLVANAIMQEGALRRRKHSLGNPVPVPVHWKPEPPAKRVKGEFKDTFKIGFYQRDFAVFSAWAECLGIDHNGSRHATTRIMREIAQGRIALVAFDSYEEYVAVLRTLSYVRKTFKDLRRPVALCVAGLIKSLGLLRRVLYIANRPDPLLLLHDLDEHANG
jgi:hypothetical protein